MLKSIDPLLHGALLALLDDMGHGSEIVIADANFPSVELARRHVELAGASADRVLDAVLTVLPLDDFVDAPVAVMQGPDDAEALYDVFRHSIERAEARPVSMSRLEPAAFYERTRAAFAVISTGEARLYGNILLRKGVLRPEPVAR